MINWIRRLFLTNRKLGTRAESLTEYMAFDDGFRHGYSCGFKDGLNSRKLKKKIGKALK